MLRIALSVCALCTVLTAASGCRAVTSKRWRFQFCKPDGWQVDLRTRDLPFLCSKPTGECTVPGGFPYDGLAALWVTPAEASGDEGIGKAKSLDDLDRAIGATSPSRERDVFSEVADGRLIRGIRRKEERDGGLVGVLIVYKYAVSVDGRLFYMALECWAGDAKGPAYAKETVALIKSIRSTE